VFGRVQRAVKARYGECRAAAVLRVYSPDATSSALTIGLGAAAVGSGAAIVTLPVGRQVSAVSEAVDRVLRWGRPDQGRYLRLPPRVLVMVLNDRVVLHEWTLVGGIGEKAAVWLRGALRPPKSTSSMTAPCAWSSIKVRWRSSQETAARCTHRCGARSGL
jgi:hypothetical protein